MTPEEVKAIKEMARRYASGYGNQNVAERAFLDGYWTGFDRGLLQENSKGKSIAPKKYPVSLLELLSEPSN